MKHIHTLEVFMDNQFSARIILVVSLLALCGLLPAAQGSEYWFPHLVDGNAGDYFFCSTFNFNNVQDTPTQVSLHFITETGTPWTIDLRSYDRPEADGVVYTTTFTLAPWETANFFTGGVDPLAVGWAWVESSQPVNVYSSFTFFDWMTDPFRVIWSAGVLPSPVGTQFSFAADVCPVKDFISDTPVDMGFAIVNPNGPDAVITATLLDRTGNERSVKTIDLGPGYHYSRFMSELFDDVTWGNAFHGTVRLSSNVNISVVALTHTLNALSDAYSTLAVQTDATFRHNIVYDWEDNTSFAAAQPISAPVEVVGTMNSATDEADTDYFAIDLTAGQVLFAFVLADLAGSPLDPVLKIYDATHTYVQGSDDIVLGLRDSLIRYQAPSTGTYYIEITGFSGSHSRESFYQLYVRVK
jgi:hypothetical protein